MAKKKDGVDAFAIFTGFVAVLTVAAGIWLIASLVALKDLRTGNADLERDRGNAELFLRKTPLILAQLEGEERYQLPNDKLLLDAHMKQCGQEVGVNWGKGESGVPRITYDREDRMEARAQILNPGGVVIRFLHALESRRTLSFVKRFNAVRAGGDLSNRPGPANWNVSEISMKSPGKKETE